jgi:hypothetical protein
LRPGEDEIEGLKRKLTTKLGQPGETPSWEVRKGSRIKKKKKRTKQKQFFPSFSTRSVN